VIGSRLHEMAFPDNFDKHLQNGLKLETAYEKDKTAVYDLQLRGEYLYAACGSDGFIAYDVANVDNKGFSERMVTAPVSPLGQRLYVKTKFATSVTLADDAGRGPDAQSTSRRTEENAGHQPAVRVPLRDGQVRGARRDRQQAGIGRGEEEQRRRGDPARRRPGEQLPVADGLRSIRLIPRGAASCWTARGSMTLYGTIAYICCDRGVAVVELANPLEPKLISVLPIPDAKKIAFQFRYGWVASEKGLTTLDMTDPRKAADPDGGLGLHPRGHATSLGPARMATWQRGGSGVVIVDLEKPEHPVIDQTVGHELGLADSYQVKIGMTNARCSRTSRTGSAV